MKEFEFRLEPLLNLRKQEEKNIQKELMKLRKNYNELQEQLEEYKSDKGNWQQKLAQEQEKGINSTTLVKYHNYIEYLNEQIKETKLEMDYWREKIEECQDRLLAKVKERKKLSKLKERQAEEHWEKFLQEERKQTDEVATNNYNHNQDNSSGSII
ncbi:flagellar export protein FliJ [Halanaerobacter jeridensis]|uniref:Flagellar FliJ protein n=1 Tax=Halanaerobacter jeridensis TaxID=706427 RepID=A0A938XQA7_9FIRM|nr:flagellar export protein FliJ [Halanaerobacter jeridensis]MBM7555340.1 flagellar FliJ protein [Halanaerobacter jeridensis]